MSGESPEKDLNSSGTVPLGDFVFSMDTGELLDGSGHLVHLRRQSSEVLAYLADRLGETVSKDDLFETVWAKAVVTDDSLTQCIADIRKTLNDTNHTIVQTLPKKGFRLVPTPHSLAGGQLPQVARAGRNNLAIFGEIPSITIRLSLVSGIEEFIFLSRGFIPLVLSTSIPEVFSSDVKGMLLIFSFLNCSNFCTASSLYLPCSYLRIYALYPPILFLSLTLFQNASSSNLVIFCSAS